MTNPPSDSVQRAEKPRWERGEEHEAMIAVWQHAPCQMVLQWRGEMLPSRARRAAVSQAIDAMIAQLNSHAALVSACKEALEPGVFGELPMIDNHLPPIVQEICEQIGYGRMMAGIAYLWEQKTPGAAHSVAACTSVRRAWIKQARQAIVLAEKGTGGK